MSNDKHSAIYVNDYATQAEIPMWVMVSFTLTRERMAFFENLWELSQTNPKSKFHTPDDLMRAAFNRGMQDLNWYIQKRRKEQAVIPDDGTADNQRNNSNGGN